MAGPCNAGKTTLFNGLTGSNYKTVNYPGSTVSFSKGPAKRSLALDAVIEDTPGLNSLRGDSSDQKMALGKLLSRDSYDLMIAVVDATQLSRHLYLIDQLNEWAHDILLCVTMNDLLKSQGRQLDVQALSREMGVKAVAIDGRKKKGIRDLVEEIRQFRPQGETAIHKQGHPSKDQIRARYRKVEAIEDTVISPLPTGASGKWFNPDRLFLHPVLGGVTFIAIMFSVFSAIFWFATPFMDAIDSFFGMLIQGTKQLLPAIWVTDILADGVIAGIGSVVIFLPQIAILFLAMGYLEDTGYLARGAMVIDKPLSKIGLNGKSFVPLLSGFACAIPAIMAARTISSRKERLLTIFIIPLMSCSARLPVYVLLLSFITPREKPWIGGICMAGLYIGGIVAGTVAATIAAKLPAFRHGRGSLLLELPAYRKPQLKLVVWSTYHRSKQYIRKAGPTIVVISLALWTFTHLPLQGTTGEEGREYATVSQSYGSKIGKVLEPVMEPMGLDWRGGVAMMMGFAAREVFVSSMVLMYRVEETDDDEALRAGLLRRMQEVTFAGTDQKVYTFSSCLGLLFFFAIALQCFPTVVIAKTEIGSWKLPLIQLGIFTGTAYVGAVVIVQVLRAFGVA